MGTGLRLRSSVTRVAALSAVGAVCSIGMASATFAGEIPPAAYQSAAHRHRVPANVLFAVALQESGTLLGGRLIPWPWTLNVAGRPYRYPNRSAACAALRDALVHLPPTRVDVGLGQINVGFHGHRVAHPCALLDPYQNLDLTAALLREHYTPADDWLIAIGHYHRPAGGEPAARYRRSVERHLQRLAGPATATATTSGTTP